MALTCFRQLCILDLKKNTLLKLKPYLLDIDFYLIPLLTSQNQ